MELTDFSRKCWDEYELQKKELQEIDDNITLKATGKIEIEIKENAVILKRQINYNGESYYNGIEFGLNNLDQKFNDVAGKKRTLREALRDVIKSLICDYNIELSYQAWHDKHEGVPVTIFAKEKKG